MMSASAEYTNQVLELLEPIGEVPMGRFFGGVGISQFAGQLAIIMGNSRNVVVNELTRKKYQALGMQSFS